MSDLLPLVVGLSLLASFFILVLPRIWQRRVEGETVEDWLSVRRRETDDEDLLSDAQLRMWDDKDVAPSEGAVSTDPVRYRSQLALLSVLIVTSVLIYDKLGAYEDVEITRAIAALDSATPADVTELIERIESRSADRPGNLDYQSLLGEYYFETGNATEALARFEIILLEAPNAPEVLGKAAQAEFVAEGQVLTDQARTRAEQALRGDPRQQSALAALAMGSFGAGAYQQAIGYLRVLRDSESPGSDGYQLMTSAIAEAEARLEPVSPGDPGSLPAVSSDSTNAVSVIVRLPAEVDASAFAGASVFVIARPAGSQARMPTAVIRVPSGDWPVSVTLTDDNSMAGQTLSSLERVDIEVQVSISGQPGRENAALAGEYLAHTVASPSVVEIVLRSPGQ